MLVQSGLLLLNARQQADHRSLGVSLSKLVRAPMACALSVMSCSVLVEAASSPVGMASSWAPNAAIFCCTVWLTFSANSCCKLCRSLRALSNLSLSGESNRRWFPAGMLQGAVGIRQSLKQLLGLFQLNRRGRTWHWASESWGIKDRRSLASVSASATNCLACFLASASAGSESSPGAGFPDLPAGLWPGDSRLLLRPPG